MTTDQILSDLQARMEHQSSSNFFTVTKSKNQKYKFRGSGIDQQDKEGVGDTIAEAIKSYLDGLPKEPV